jgi:hypothetical protein
MIRVQESCLLPLKAEVEREADNITLQTCNNNSKLINYPKPLSDKIQFIRRLKKCTRSFLIPSKEGNNSRKSYKREIRVELYDRVILL